MIAVRKQILSAGVFLCLAAGSRGAWAQSEGSGLNPFQPTKSGIQLYDVTLFSQYYSMARPAFSVTASQPQNLGFDVASGVTGTLGWNHPGLRTSAGFTYTGTYARRARYSEWDTNDHALSLWLHRTLSRSWDLRFSGEGSVRTLDQFLFQNAQVLSWASLPGTFDDLSAAMLRGEYSNQQLASMLTGLPVVSTPAQTLIYGNRFFSSGASATLSYAPVPRLRITWGAGGGRIQALPGSVGQRALLNQSTRGNSNLGISYALTPRTELGFTATAGRQFSIVSNQYNLRGMATLSRALTRQWFLSLEAGGGTYLYTADSAARSPVQTLGGVTLAHRGRSQTWMLTAKRSLADTYGVGSRSTVVADLGWSWSPPGSNWALSASGSQQYMDQSLLNAFSAWRMMGGVGRQIARGLVFKTEYSYMDYRMTATPAQGLLPHASQHAVRVALIWNPMGSN